MESNENLLNKPIWQMTGAEFLRLSQIGSPVSTEQPKQMTSQSKKYVYGLDGLARLCGCSKPTANRIKQSGILDAAIKQIGRKIIVDAEMALQLLSKKEGIEQEEVTSMDNALPIITTQSIINDVMMDMEGVDETGFPLHVFPDLAKHIVLDLSCNEGYHVEFTASCMLSAVGTALGNARHIHMRGLWYSSAAMYMILAGRPGLGKSHPLDTIYVPFKDADRESLSKYKDELSIYKACESKDDRPPKPKLKKIIVSDFTPEALMLSHSNNRRGIVINNDEIISTFNTVNRYNSSNLIELLLTSWSGKPLDIIRKSDDMPLHIEHPCISMCGTIQTDVISGLFGKGYEKNGLLDRIVFVYPRNAQVPYWIDTPDTKNPSVQTLGVWCDIMRSIMQIDCDSENPKTLEILPDAKTHLTGWWNAIVDEVNSIDHDRDVDSRQFKWNSHVGRFALSMQALRWACGEASLDAVDIDSIKAAIELNDYYEDSFTRLRASIKPDMPEDTEELPKSRGLLDSLGETFTTSEAKAVAKELRIPVRTLFERLRQHVARHEITREGHGTYRKVQK